MPRSLEDLIAGADALADAFEAYEPQPGDQARVSPMTVLHLAALRRADAERELATAVAGAREAGTSWRDIGAAVGTSGEAARQRYGSQPVEPGAAGDSVQRTVRTINHLVALAARFATGLAFDDVTVDAAHVVSACQRIRARVLQDVAATADEEVARLVPGAGRARLWNLLVVQTSDATVWVDADMVDEPVAGGAASGRPAVYPAIE